MMWTLTVLYLLPVSGVIASQLVQNLSTFCGYTLPVYGSSIVQVEPNTTFPHDEDCEVEITAYDDFESNIGVIVSFLDFRLLCDEGSLYITGYDAGSQGAYFCGSSIPTEIYKSYLKSLTVRYKRKMKNSSNSHFQLLVTQIHEGRCSNQEFRCDNSFCVNKYSVLCNGYNNCGDESDEERGCRLGPAVIAGIVLGSLAGAVILVCVVILIYRKVRYETIADSRYRNQTAIADGQPALQATENHGYIKG